VSRPADGWALEPGTVRTIVRDLLAQATGAANAHGQGDRCVAIGLSPARSPSSSRFSGR